MADAEEWPAPPGDRVLVLADASTPVERELLDEWTRTARPPATAAGDVQQVVLPDLESALGNGFTAEGDPWLTPIRVVWLPPERDGQRVVRLRDVVLSLDNPRHPRAARQRRIARDQPDRYRIAVGEPARASELDARWRAIGVDG